eukprot:TRINITY_DN8162_c0_g1_i1.p1 TRINITY_DN8162_c0_g1~~TRINITY_DN8162_c0_g1_i1.p1  ORF type:complete len:266 (+),score=45.40 TRINITY_DN8162_c0_g1_i1:587-1384(+)
MSAILTIFTSNDIVILTPSGCHSVSLGAILHIQHLQYCSGDWKSDKHHRWRSLSHCFPAILEMDGHSCFHIWSGCCHYLVDHLDVVKLKRSGAIVGSMCLILCLGLLATSSFHGLPLWIITSASALMTRPKSPPPKSIEDGDLGDHQMVILEEIDPADFKDVDLKEESKTPSETRPWKIVPFVLGMFILVHSLDIVGLIPTFAKGLSSAVRSLDHPLATILMLCLLSCLLCNVLNNQPMTILMTGILVSPEFIVSPSQMVPSISL